MSKNTPVVILTNPQMGENIGATARAMLNFGLAELRLVAPRDGWPNERAVDMSAGALEKMPPVQVFDTLQDAIADLHVLYATTARPRDMVKPVLTPRQAAMDASQRIENNHAVGFVFGAERAGMSNDEVALCHNIVNIPTNPDFSSLNLGQAVLLMAHEYYQATNKTIAKALDLGASPPASQKNFEHFFKRLEGELADGGFFQAEGLRPTMLKNIRSIFTRAELSEQEVNTLQGIISALIGKKTQHKSNNKKAAKSK